MTRVAILRSNPKDAGIVKILVALSMKYAVDCFIWDRQGDYRPPVENKNITYRKCHVRASFHNATTFCRLFLFEIWLFLRLLFAKVDVIHAIDLDTGLVGLCIAKLRAKRLAYQCLDPYYGSLPKTWPTFLATIAKRIENMVISGADLFIISDLARMPQHNGAKPKRTLEIANVPYLDIPQYSGVKENGFLVGYLGTLTEGRNLTVLIEAVDELKDEGVKLIIGGFGPLHDPIREKASHYENIFFTSWLPYKELLKMESAFDLFVHIIDKNDEGQRWGSPNKLFESMVFGKPIIVGQGTLSEERVNTIGNGVAVRYGQKEELRRAIIAFKNNPGLAMAMGEKGKREFERNYRPEVIGKRLLEAYQALLASKRNPASF